MRRLFLLITLCASIVAAQTVTTKTLRPAYGQLYEDGAGTAINITTGGTFVKWVSSTAGLSALTTLSTGDDDITIDTGGAGTYLAAFEVSYIGDSAEIYHWGVHVGGVKQNMASSEIKVGAGDMDSQSGIGLLALSDGDVIDLRVTSTGDTKTATVNHAQLTLWRIGP